MLKPLITFTTDFGGSDHFAATMKGVVLGIAPEARIVDITHDVTAFEVPEAAYTLAQAYRFFPKKTIHVVVVDPGVGSARRPILAEMAGQYFVAPDNGVLSMIFSREQSKVRHITNPKYMLHPVSGTFHGRDVFAPSAAHLANGVAPAKFGKLIADPLRLQLDRPTRTGKRVWTGTVLKVDRFGNLITNLHVDDFPQVATRPFELNVGLEKIERLARTFSECAPGEAFAIVGSSGYIEVAVNQGSAARSLGCAAGSPVELALY
jgi:S-adenosylmethionine hydrolase